MSTPDVDHNHYTLERGDHSQETTPPSNYDSTARTVTSSLVPNDNTSTLPAYIYAQSPSKRSKVAARFEQNATSAYANGLASDGSPDPHDFYRRPLQGEEYDITSVRSDGSNRVDRWDGGMVGSVHQTRIVPISTKVNSRYNSAPTDRSPLSGARSSPTLSKTARNRQTSLKELVEKFNQNPDEALPLPKRSDSKSPSATSGGHSVSRAHTSSLSNRQGHGSVTKVPVAVPAPATGMSRTYRHAEGTDEGKDHSPRSRRLQRSQRADHFDTRPYASQSTTSLSNARLQRPLFGEILAINPNQLDPGHELPPSSRRRRGSEGSMHSPNPMFPQERCQPDVSPSSPAAWYLGVTPTLEEIKTEKAIPELPPSLHRRTKSDFTGGPAKPPPSRLYGTTLPTPRDLPSTPSSTNSSKRNSQSRIPISTRRMSATSDSGNSTQSTRANSALGRAKIKPPARMAGHPSQHGKYPRSPPQHSRSSTPQKSPHRSDFGLATQRTSPSPHLRAYISAPMPKKSPPLRSSKPRQPVSSASTSASRARVVERFSSHENARAKSTRERKPYKPPELAGVDFAARREKIQKAVTQTVQENERLDEQRRASMALGNQTLGVSAASNENSGSQSQEGIPSRSQKVCKGDSQHVKEDEVHSTNKETARSERDLTINTGQLSERSVLDMSTEDSPTLGMFNRFTTNPGRVQNTSVTPPSDIEPTSAITAGTSGSVDTFFDDEPQDVSLDAPRKHSHEHQTLLTHIMTMRDSSPSPEGAQERATTEGSASDRDDGESIQIMLGDSPVLEKAPSKEQLEAKLRDSQSVDGQDRRWSMGSWSSSTRSKDERDAPMERIDEHSPPSPEQQGHLSVSTSGSQQTPQPWSPASFASAQTARTTMDSDTYSTINRILDHYHDPSLVSPQMMQDVQQHILNQSPDLARQGGWDPKKVTQLFLQELARERYRQTSTTLDDPSPQHRPRTDSTKAPEVPEKEVREDHDEKMVEQMEHDYDELTPPATSLAVDEDDFRPARASLNRLEDWDMSPSLGGLELQAGSLDSPIGEQKPVLPSNHWDRVERGFDDTSVSKEGQATQDITDSGPRLPPIDGLGIEINIMGPQRTDSPLMQPPPPLPIYSPPLPPSVELSAPTIPRSPPSPSTYGKHIASSIYPANAPDDVTVQAIPCNDHPQPRSAASSIQPSGSSIAYQDRQSADGPSTEDMLKNSPPSPDQKRLTRRRFVIQEIVDTEHTFGQDMKVVDDIYKGTSNVIVISAKDVKTLFGNLNDVVAFSTLFLDALKQASRSVYVLPKSKRWRSNRVSNATSYSGNTDDQSSINGTELNDEEKDRKTTIGEAFGNHMARLDQVYTEYLRNMKAALERLAVLQEDPKVQIWLKECRAYAHDLTSAWDLHALLIKPFQRVTKFPLLLKELVEVTSEHHPDFTALEIAHREMKSIINRMNEMGPQPDISQQISHTGRKRKESESRPRIFTRQVKLRAEKSKILGSTAMIEDKAYSAVSERFGSHFFQLQVVMRDVEMYTTDVQTYMNKFCELALAMEGHVEIGPPSSYPEVESKWHKFRMSTREMSMTALTDHVAAVRKNVIEPMNALLRMHEGPQKMMHKRNKRVADYNRLKTIKERGDKPDKKTVEQGEQFQYLNELLKDELPKLFAMTAKLVEACLNSFVQLQVQWQVIWRRKLSQALDDQKAPGSVQEIQDAFAGDFKFVEASVLSLGICNGSMLGAIINQIPLSASGSTTLNGDDGGMLSHGPSFESRRRTLSVSSEQSPVLPQPDFGGRGSGSFFNIGDATQQSTGGNFIEPSRRLRASSTLSGHSPRTPEIPGSYPHFSNNATPVNLVSGRPSNANPRTFTEPLPSPSRLSIETPSLSRPSEESVRDRLLGSTYPRIDSQARAGSPSQRYSGFFSSAMPMSDSPRTESPAAGQAHRDFNVIFLAASVYEFNIDRQRREAGYPYLTYAAGEIFDVIGEKGELWLAKNQDDSSNEVGWIWNKHFVKLAA